MWASSVIFAVCVVGAVATADFALFTGKYSDPNHPSCARNVVRSGFTTAKVYGADAAGGEGVACDGTTDIKWGPLPGTINGINIVVDFSSKGGPSNLAGSYNTAKNEIDWSDGNAWKKI